MKKALFFVAAFVALVTLGCSNNAQKVSLDIRFNALAEDSTNYFKWSEYIYFHVHNISKPFV